MEFLVHIEVRWPPEGDARLLAELTEAERVRARELAAAGVIRRLWRIPGRRANWGLWEARDATELHAALASLPLFPWLDVDVHPLAAHPSDPAASPAEAAADRDDPEVPADGRPPSSHANPGRGAPTS
jgi:muconolactone D-isomerase